MRWEDSHLGMYIVSRPIQFVGSRDISGEFTLHAVFLFFLVGAWAAASYLGVATGGDSIGGRWRCVCAR